MNQTLCRLIFGAIAVVGVVATDCHVCLVTSPTPSRVRLEELNSGLEVNAVKGAEGGHARMALKIRKRGLAPPLLGRLPLGAADPALSRGGPTQVLH
eukprot:scaffold324083_cov66-Tisochrysis_lutea.AAC.3